MDDVLMVCGKINTAKPPVAQRAGGTSLEEWFTPPLTSSPGFDFFAILVVIVFSLFFQHLFSSILAPSWLPKLVPNGFKTNKKINPKKSNSTIFNGFWSHFGSQDGTKIDEKRCWKNDEKTMTTKMAKKSNAGAYETALPGDPGSGGVSP